MENENGAAFSLTRRIGSTNYIVNVHCSESATETLEDRINDYYDNYETEFLFLSEEEVETFEQKMLTLQVDMNKLLEKVKYCFNHAEELLKIIEEEEAAEEAQLQEEQNE